MVDIIFTLCSNRIMRITHGTVLKVARQAGGRVAAPLSNLMLPMKLDLLVPGSLLALLIIGRGAGTG
jgi:hypothetical protein